MPTKGHKIINNHGTAPGAWFEQEDHCAVLMPGVPHEMKAMWTESVRPLLLARQNCTLHSVTLRVLGGESNIEYRVKHLLENANPTAAIYCKTGECEIRITARASSEEDGEKMCRAYATKFYDLLGDAVYDEDVAGLEETVVRTLKEQGLTLSTAESCTGGMIAQRVTSVSGSSEVFGYGFVTYWEQAKTRLVGVEPEVIAKYNVVSAPVAARMALGAAAASGSDIAVSVTGVAGPTGGDEVRPVGTVYLGAARGDTVYVQKLFVSRPDRALVRARAAQAALALALRLAQGKVPAHTKPSSPPRSSTAPPRWMPSTRRFWQSKHLLGGIRFGRRKDKLCAAPVWRAAGAAGRGCGAVCAPVEDAGPVEEPRRGNAAGPPGGQPLGAEKGRSEFTGSI